MRIFVAFMALLVVSTTLLYLYCCKNRVYKLTTALCPEARTILDLGCGACCTTAKLSKMGKQVVSLDVVNNGVCNVPILFDGHNIPFASDSFDLGICSFVLHHTKQYTKLLHELKRVCTKVLVIENTPETDREWEYIRVHANSHWGHCVDCFSDSTQWKKIFKQTGFKVEKERTISKWLCPFSDKPFYYPVTSTAYLLSKHVT